MVAGGRGWQGPLSSPVRGRENEPNPSLEPPSQDDFCWPHALRVSLALGFAGWMGEAPACCPAHARLCMGTAKHPCSQRGSGLMLWLFLLSCITVTGPSALTPRPCRHQYCRPVCIATMAPSELFPQTRLPSPAGLLPVGWGSALGTPSPSLPSSVPQGAAWAGKWVAGSCCSRWSTGLDHGTARNEGCVCPPGGPFAGAGCELVPAGPQHLPARPRHGSQHVSRDGCG